LITINDEAKVRRSIKLVILGKTKVMSYENLVAKRVKRETKEQDKAKRKRKRDRKRKSSKEANALKLARMSEAQIKKNEIASKS